MWGNPAFFDCVRASVLQAAALANCHCQTQQQSNALALVGCESHCRHKHTHSLLCWLFRTSCKCGDIAVSLALSLLSLCVRSRLTLFATLSIDCTS